MTTVPPLTPAAPAASDGVAVPGRQSAVPPRPRIGFLGAGWIGRHRMHAIVDAGIAEPVAICDPSPECVAAADDVVPGMQEAASLDELLTLELDGLVIATPSALHAGQAIAALDRGVAVFCQKPLARDAAETRQVVHAARRSGRLLGVDLSYRETMAMQRMREIIRSGDLGDVYTMDLVFHNAYGPDKPWFRDPALSGGGCVIDLGIHLVDLALWLLEFPQVRAARGHLYANGAPITDAAAQVEDYAIATLELAGGVTARLACSWHLHAGQDAAIEVSCYGTRGGVRMRNVDGSFYDFAADRLTGTSRQSIAEPPDDWGGRAAVKWAKELANGGRYDPAVEAIVGVAEVLDAIYGRGPAR